MKEIELAIADLRKLCEEKTDELPSNATYARTRLENRKRDIDVFEDFYNKREKNPAHRNEVLSRFRKRAAEISEQIQLEAD